MDWLLFCGCSAAKSSFDPWGIFGEICIFWAKYSLTTSALPNCKVPWKKWKIETTHKQVRSCYIQLTIALLHKLKILPSQETCPLLNTTCVLPSHHNSLSLTLYLAVVEFLYIYSGIQKSDTKCYKWSRTSSYSLLMLQTISGPFKSKSNPISHKFRA